MTNSNPHIKTFNISSIGWVILIAGFLLSAGAGISNGLILASINWLKLEKRGKAIGALGIGVLFAVLFSIITYVWKIQNPLPSTLQRISSVILQGVLILLSIAIVEKLLRNDFAPAQNGGTNFETYSIGTTIITALVGVIVMWVLMTVVGFGVAVYLAPKVKVTSEFVPGGSQTVTGSINAWSKEPVANRQLALCKLSEQNPLSPYDCLVTKYTATTDSSGNFQIKEVPIGKYLIIYNTGSTDFQKGLQIWQGKELKPGDISWEVEHYYQLYSENYGKVCYLVMPGNHPADFYSYKAEYVFTQCNSYFFLAHDIQAAITYKYVDEDYRKPLPSGIFKPVVVDVAPNKDSFVTFNVLYAPR